jgi:hypothetical protein
MRILVLVRVLHRHRPHVPYIAPNIPNTSYASLIVLIVLILVTHLAFSLTEAINDEEEKRERNCGSDASRY